MQSILAGLAAAAIIITSGPSRWEPPRAAQGALAGGRAWADVVPDSDGAWLIHAAVDIPAPPGTVWAVMTDCRLAAKLITTVTSCKVLSGDQRKGWDVREEVTRGTMFLPEIHNIMRTDYQPFSDIRFRRVGGNLKSEQGEWRLEPIDGGGSRVIYVNRVAVNLLVPAFLVRAGMKRDVPKVMLNLRRESLAALRR